MSKADYYAVERRSHKLDRSKMLVMPAGRAAVLSAGWQKFHPTEDPILVEDAWGHPRWITVTQHRVLAAARRLTADHSERVSMRLIASSLGVSGSTVSRALLRLATLGLVAYDVQRGRNGGVAFLRSVGNLKDRAKAAWDRINGERERALIRARERLERSGYPFAEQMLRTERAMSATFNWMNVGKVPWTAADMADAGL